MIRLIEAKNYRSLKYISQELENFQVLVGPNASGKTTFLDVIQFISDIISDGVDSAITKRSSNFNDLTFSGLGGGIELAIEVTLPLDVIEKMWTNDYDTIRYEISIGLNDITEEHEIKEENVLLKKYKEVLPQSSLFPNGTKEVALSILNFRDSQIWHPYSLKRNIDGFVIFNHEQKPKTDGVMAQNMTFNFGKKKSALGNLPLDEVIFPASTWLREYIVEGIQMFILDSINIRKASPPGQSKKFKTDGSNLPWVINDLMKHPKLFGNWIRHLRTALPDIETISTVEREDDRHRYLRIKYNNGITVPSWLVSDGTLRLLALTLPAYLPDFSGVYLIEEPENGIHPKAIEAVYQSLSSVYNAQILMATHSPVILSLVKPEEILCFAKTEGGVTDIVRGDKHPALQSWKGEVNLSILFAGGVLG